MRIAGLVVMAGVLLGVAVAWCLVSGKPVSHLGVDAITAATRPSSPRTPRAPSSKAGDTQSAASTQAQDEANIAEAVFRYLFQHKPSTQTETAAYFIGFGTPSSPRDPNAEFLKRFQTNGTPVKAASLSKRADGGAVVDKASSKPALLFRLERIRWVNKDTADVQGGCTESSKTSTTSVYKVVRQQGVWAVTADKPGTLS